MMTEQSNTMKEHFSDCAVHNAPALPVGPCNCKAFCDPHFDGLGTECRRCGSWKRGKDAPECPPYITRIEPDGKRLPHVTTAEENNRAWVTWGAFEDVEHPKPASIND